MSEQDLSRSGRDGSLSFVQHNFDNHQALIRAADTKAGFLVTILLFLGASTIPLGKEVVPKLHLTYGVAGLLSCLYIVSYFALTLGFLWALNELYFVVAPRGASHYAAPRPGHDLVFYEHVLLHRDHNHYFASISEASPDLLLRNLTDQVFELAHICREKMTGLKKTKSPIRLAICAWLINIGMGLWIGRPQ